MKHDFEVNVKKNKKANARQPIPTQLIPAQPLMTQQFNIGRDDDSDDDFGRLFAPFGRGDAESFVSGGLGDWQDRLRDEPTQQAAARVPYLGVSRIPSDASFPMEEEATSVQ